MNLLFKFIGKLIMEIDEDEGTLAVEQYGSRKYKAAITQCLNKRLFMEIVRQRKCKASICSNDCIPIMLWSCHTSDGQSHSWTSQDSSILHLMYSLYDTMYEPPNKNWIWRL